MKARKPKRVQYRYKNITVCATLHRKLFSLFSGPQYAASCKRKKDSVCANWYDQLAFIEEISYIFTYITHKRVSNTGEFKSCKTSRISCHDSYWKPKKTVAELGRFKLVGGYSLKPLMKWVRCILAGKLCTWLRISDEICWLHQQGAAPDLECGRPPWVLHRDGGVRCSSLQPLRSNSTEGWE